jgi:hypothetical protein
MAITIDQAFITQFGAEVKHSYQSASRLIGAVRKREGVIGSTSRFQKLGAVAAYTKVRNADLTVLEPAHTYTDVTLADKYATVLVDDLDLLKSNVDIKQEYVKTVAYAIGREMDAVIITALTAGSNVPTTNAGAMTVARWLEIKKLMDNGIVPAEGRNIVFGAAAMEDLLGTTQVTSTDFNSVKALVQGDLNSFLGFNVHQVPDSYLTLNTTPTPDTRVNLAFHRDALGVAIGQNMKTMIEWSADKHAYWIKGIVSMGAGIVDTAGVVEFEVDI